MIKDRLPEVIKIRKNIGLPIYEDDPDQVTIPIDGSEAVLLQILDKIGPLYHRVKELSLEVTELRKGLNQPDSKEKLGRQIEDIKEEATSLYKAIQEINGYSSNDYRLISHVAKTHHLSLVTYFEAANSALADLQNDIHEKHKNYVKKELQITGQAVNDDDVENLLGNGIFTKNFLEDTRIAKEHLFDMRQRHDEFTKIEQNIVEVNALFQELANLVKHQGEAVDRVENYIFEAHEKVEESKGQLISARRNQTKARKKKIILCAILAIVILILIIVFVT